MPDLLLELFSEEIPARMQRRAARDFERLVNDRLLSEGIMPEGVKAFSTPRRLALVATGLAGQQADKKEERKGPRVGAPDKAIEGFLRGAGLDSLDACETRSDKKGDYYVAVLERKGRPTPEIIADMVPEIIRGFPWPKSMRWGDGDLRWVRPLKSILCTFDSEIVAFSAGDLQAGDTSEGHRFMAPGRFQCRTFDDYSQSLRQRKVVLDADERGEKIIEEARMLCTAQGLELVEDKGLLEEVAGLAEWPVVMIGSYNEKFLTLPDEVLTASMRGHQKYFSVRNPATGRLANKFVVVANIEALDGGAAMRSGYARVLTARLSDGWFLYKDDLKKPLADRITELDKVTFFEKLGSVGDKIRRVAALAREIAYTVGADPDSAERAALLSKADLVTGMVYEFPELQGVMGRYYALAQNEPAEIAEAIRDHYKPQGQDDDISTAPVSIAVALADKIDTLTAFWSIDKKPTGSSDPFALRRAALGVIRIIIENEIRFDIPTRSDDLVDFFHDRFAVYLRERDFQYDYIRAALAPSPLGVRTDLYHTYKLLRAFRDLLGTDEGTNLVAGYKRAANILKAEAKKADLPGADQIRPDRFGANEEAALFNAVEAVETTLASSLAEENFEAAMRALASLRAPVDAFFDAVTVNADDPDLRQNRLALLARFRDATRQIADFEQIEG